MPIAIDFSEQNPSKEQLAQAIADLDIKRAIIRLTLTRDWTQIKPFLIQNVRDCVDLGLQVHAYLPPYWGSDCISLAWVTHVKANEASLPIEFWWTDLEKNPFAEPDKRLPYPLALWGQLAVLPEGKRGIYASENTWRTMVDNTRYLGEFPLWLALWDHIPSIKPVNFGSFHLPVMKQYEADLTINAGFTVDLNWYEK